MARLTLASCMVVFALALLSKCHATAGSSAMPTGRQDEGRAEQDTSPFMGGETVAENFINALASNPTWNSGLLKEEGGTKSFILTNFGLKRPSWSTQAPALLHVLRFPQIQEAGTTLTGHIKVEERRGTDKQIPIQRKDVNMHNCMLGRMYRPCWQL